MPKHVKRIRLYQQIADVTVNEFANAKAVAANNRIRKKNSKALSANETTIDDNDEIDEISNSLKSLKTNSTAATEIETQEYKSYPNDVWFLISDHIQPDDVRRFALICKQTYAITSTMKFWRNLYRRHYDDRINLPVRLQPDCMARPGGIRACCIRSLFYTYTPLVERLTAQSHQDFHSLERRYVERFWFQHIKGNKWKFFYKLKRKALLNSRIADSEDVFRRNSKSLKSLRDVYLNPEEGCALLVIETTKFHPLPRINDEMESTQKLTLSTIRHCLSRSCSHYRLEMRFANASRQDVAMIAYEPTQEIRVYDWWTPTYAKYVKPGTKPDLEYLCDEKDANDEPGITDDDAWDFVINQFS